MKICEQEINMLKSIRRINENVGRSRLRDQFSIFAVRSFEHPHARRPDGNNALGLVDLARSFGRD